MPFALTIFGTPDGFDYIAEGDTPLNSKAIIENFDAMDLSTVNIPFNAKVWGVFKKTTEFGDVIGVGLFSRAYEHLSNRSGGYLGVGFLFQDATANANQIISALREFHAEVNNVVLNPKESRFLASKFKLLPRVRVPQSCLDVKKSLSRLTPTNPFARLSLNRLCIKVESSQIPLLLHSILQDQHALSECSIFMADNKAVLDVFSKDWGATVDDTNIYEKLRDSRRSIKEAEEREKRAQLAKETEERNRQARLIKEAEERERQAQLTKETEERNRQARLIKEAEERERQAQLARETEERNRQARLANERWDQKTVSAYPLVTTTQRSLEIDREGIRNAVQDEVRQQLLGLEQLVDNALRSDRRQYLLFAAIVGAIAGGMTGVGMGWIAGKAVGTPVLHVTPSTSPKILTPPVPKPPSGASTAPVAPSTSSVLGVYADDAKVTLSVGDKRSVDSGVLFTIRSGNTQPLVGWITPKKQKIAHVCFVKTSKSPKITDCLNKEFIGHIEIVDAKNIKNFNSDEPDVRLIAQHCAEKFL